LDAKRERILEAFFSGLIMKGERDRRIADLDAEKSSFGRELGVLDGANAENDENVLIGVFAGLKEWRHWDAANKRSVLTALSADILVSDCAAKVIEVRNVVSSGSRTGKGSSRQPA